MFFSITKENMIADVDYRGDIPIYKLLLDFLNMDLSNYNQSDFTSIKLLDRKEATIYIDYAEYSNYKLKYLIANYIKERLSFSWSYKGTYNIDPGEVQGTENDKREKRYIKLREFQVLVRKLVNDMPLVRPELHDLILTANNISYSIHFSGGQIHEIYRIKTIERFCIFAITKLFHSNTIIKKCENCSDFFVPSDAREVYCDKIHPNGRTCKDMGYENKINSDDIMKEYRRAYKNKNAIKNRNKHNPNAEKDFKQWVYAAKLKMQLCKDEELTLEEFKKWLNNN